MDSTALREALAAGRMDVIMGYVRGFATVADESIDATIPCFCGKPNHFMATRIGVTIIQWSDIIPNHNVTGAGNGLDVVVHTSETEAVSCFGDLRTRVEQVLGRAQYAAAVTGNPQAGPGGDFMVI